MLSLIGARDRSALTRSLYSSNTTAVCHPPSPLRKRRSGRLPSSRSALFITVRIFSICSFQGAISAVELPSGDGEIRTLDPLLARQVLSQLSYTPTYSGAHLLFHTVSSIVPSAARVLTIVFGMGTGVSPARIGTRNISLPFGNLTVKLPLLLLP